MKKTILILIIGIIIGITVTVTATVLYSAKDIEYKDSNVEDAINDLYSIKDERDELFDLQANPKYLYSYMTSGVNLNAKYTFTEDVNYGYILVSGVNNVIDESYSVAIINSLSNGTYKQIDKKYNSYNATNSMEHNVRVYEIKDVKKGSVIDYSTRYIGSIYIFKVK